MPYKLSIIFSSIFSVFSIVIGLVPGCSTPDPSLSLTEIENWRQAAARLPAELSQDAGQVQRLETHPRMQSIRQDIMAAYGRRIQESLWNNPRLEVTGEDIGGAEGGLPGSQVTLSLIQELPINGAWLLAARAAGKEEDEARWQYQEEMLTFISEIYLAFYQAAIADKREQDLRALVERADHFLEKVKTTVEFGKAAKSDLLKAEIAQVNAQTKLSQAENARNIAKTRLAALLSLEVERLPRFPQPLAIPASLPSWEQLQSRIQSSPPLKKIGVIKERLALQKSQFQAQIWPNLEVSVGARRNYADNQNSLVLGAGLSLPVWNRNQGRIYEIEAGLEKTVQEQKRIVWQLETELLAAYHRHRTALQTITSYQTKLLPAAQESVQIAAKGYEEGKFSTFEVTNTQQTQLEMNLEFWHEMENLYTARAEIYKIVGPWEDAK